MDELAVTRPLRLHTQSRKPSKCRSSSRRSLRCTVVKTAPTLSIEEYLAVTLTSGANYEHGQEYSQSDPSFSYSFEGRTSKASSVSPTVFAHSKLVNGFSIMQKSTWSSPGEGTISSRKCALSTTGLKSSNPKLRKRAIMA